MFSLPKDLDEIAFLTKEDVVFFHQEVLLPGQLRGFKSASDLDSAIGRVTSAAVYDSSADMAKLAAYYWHGISANHAFCDGNKRTGLVAMVSFLDMNGLEFVAPDDDMGPLIEELFECQSFNLETLDQIIRTHTRPLVE